MKNKYYVLYDLVGLFDELLKLRKEDLFYVDKKNIVRKEKMLLKAIKWQKENICKYFEV